MTTLVKGDVTNIVRLAHVKFSLPHPQPSSALAERRIAFSPQANITVLVLEKRVSSAGVLAERTRFEASATNNSCTFIGQ